MSSLLRIVPPAPPDDLQDDLETPVYRTGWAWRLLAWGVLGLFVVMLLGYAFLLLHERQA